MFHLYHVFQFQQTGKIMNFRQMKSVEPELARLEASAENAGRHQADWMATLLAIHERLSKLAGHAHVRARLRTSRSSRLTAINVPRSPAGQHRPTWCTPPGRGSFRAIWATRWRRKQGPS